MTQQSEFPPIRCDEIRPLLPRYWKVQLDEVRERLVRTHLMDCEPCQEAYQQVIDADTTEPEWPAVDALLKRAEQEMAAETEQVGTPVGRLLQLRQRGGQWVEDALDQLRELLLGRAWQPAYGIPMRGSLQADDAPAENEVAAAVLDDGLNATGRREFLRKDEAPAVDTEGRFHLGLGTDEPELAGWTLLCTVASPDGTRFTFEAELTGEPGGPWLAQVREPVFDPAPEVTPIPWDALQFSLRPAPQE